VGRFLFFVTVFSLSGCASLQEARSPASNSSGASKGQSLCQMVEPFSEADSSPKTESSSNAIRILKSKGYLIVPFNGATPTETAYFESLKEGESGIVTTTGNSMDPNYLRLVVLKKWSGQVQVIKILTSTSSKNIEELFLQLPNCS
jgi:hypothetical protein